MAKSEKPLPRPPGSPFGRGRGGREGAEAEPLTADRMAQAVAAGRLEEFLDREVPDNPRARELATMMLGMTGMLPPGGGGPAAAPGPAAPAEGAAPAPVPEEVLAAVQGGDVGGVVDALRREHERRSSGGGPTGPSPEPGEPPAGEAPPSAEGPRATIDRETVDALLGIAADNGVTPDWITFRALKLYVAEYRRTGRL